MGYQSAMKKERDDNKRGESEKQEKRPEKIKLKRIRIRNAAPRKTLLIGVLILQ